MPRLDATGTSFKLTRAVCHEFFAHRDDGAGGMASGIVD
jgi:hypothetical protein